MVDFAWASSRLPHFSSTTKRARQHLPIPKPNASHIFQFHRSERCLPKIGYRPCKFHLPPRILSSNCSATFPSKLRLTIWELALPGPRIVHFQARRVKGGTCVRVRSDKPNDSAGNEVFFQHPLVTQRLYHRFNHSTPGPSRATLGVHFGPESCWAPETFLKVIPALLLACKESHRVAAKVYTQAFGTFGARASTWFSFELDTLYIDDEAIVGFERGRYNQECLGFQFDLSRVKTLAIGAFEPDIGADTKYYLDWMANFENLENFYIVKSVHNYTDDRSNLVFMDDFDINMVMDHYNDGYDYNAHLNFQDEEEAEVQVATESFRGDI